MKKYLWLLLIPLVVTGCKRIPKLEDGKQVVVSVGDKQFTAEEFYEALKNQNGVNILISMVDNYIANTSLSEDELNDALESAESMYNYYYALYNSNWSDFLKYYGFNSDEELKEQLLVSSKQNAALEKYVTEDVVKEEDIKKYYDENIHGEMTVRHILVIPETNTNMTDAEKNEAKKKALEKAKELISQLKGSSNLEDDFAALAKEKSDDTGSAANGGIITNMINDGTYVEEFYDASLKLNVGEITAEPVETKYGYHIIYKVSQLEKPALEVVKDSVIEKVADKLLNAENASVIYWAAIREKYNMNIVDDIIKNDYNASLKTIQK